MRIEIYEHFNIEIIGVNYMVVKRGDMFYADLSPVVGSEQGGIRPVLIIQNNIGNQYSPTTVVPHAGTWIEIPHEAQALENHGRRSPRGNVD